MCFRNRYKITLEKKNKQKKRKKKKREPLVPLSVCLLCLDPLQTPKREPGLLTPDKVGYVHLRHQYLLYFLYLGKFSPIDKKFKSFKMKV